MILRRPYAFLIKHFRLIHIIMVVLSGYVTYRANNILSFFKDYIEYNGIIEINYSEYFSSFVFISLFIIIIMSIIVYLLMRYKNKPRLFYILLIIICIISGIMFIFLFNNIKSLETTILNGRVLRLFRDISRFNFWLLFISSIPILIRELGFDIKKFNFSRDLKELKLEEEDSEEVEVRVDISSDNVKRLGRRYFRELKYYYIEHKFFINIILGIVLLILILAFPFNKYVVNSNLNEGDVLKTENFNIRVNKSYISDRNRVSKDNIYVIVNISAKSIKDKYKFDLDQFVLVSDNNKYVPSMKYYYYFSDLGRGYRDNILNTNDYDEYIFVYNIKSEDSDDRLLFNYIGSERSIILNVEDLN